MDARGVGEIDDKGGALGMIELEASSDSPSSSSLLSQISYKPPSKDEGEGVLFATLRGAEWVLSVKSGSALL